MKQELEREWRRNKVLEPSSQGYSEREIGSKLQISHITVHRNLVRLKEQAQENLQHHISEVVPMEYERCIFGMKGNLKHVLEIAESSSDPRVKLEARRIANDCYDKIMMLTTNGVIVNDALRCIQSKIEHLNINTLHKQVNDGNNRKIEQTEDETTSTTNTNTNNGVF
jgi:hypothetical protein